MPPQHPKAPSAPQPSRVCLDPFNSSSTGHQRAENRLSGSTSWRESRTYKLGHQLRDSSGRGGSQHLYDFVGGGSESFARDWRKENGSKSDGAPGLREKGSQKITRFMIGKRKRPVETEQRQKRDRDSDSKKPRSSGPDDNNPACQDGENVAAESSAVTEDGAEEGLQSSTTPPQIFRNLNIYLNGSTAPLVSDLRLKQLFTQHGGSVSIGLGRRTVTHVIIGQSSGGGLASSKIQKENALVRGKGIKYVSVAWVLDSIARGVRQSEAQYVPKNLEGRLGGSGQGGVRTMFTPLEGAPGSSLT